MLPIIKKIYQPALEVDKIIIVDTIATLPKNLLSKKESDYLKKNYEKHKETKLYTFNRFDSQLIIVEICNDHSQDLLHEDARKAAYNSANLLRQLKIKEIFISVFGLEIDFAVSFSEALALSFYSFNKYKSEKKNSVLESIFIESEEISEAKINEINILCSAVKIARDLVNEPVNYLDAVKLGDEFEIMAKEVNIEIEVFNKKKIEALKMGGLLAVNQGSKTPPTFSMMSYKPKDSVNIKPLIFIGKGVVYDTGGLNIKTGSSMDGMKCDMAGAAAVAAAIYAIAKAKLPIWVISMVPATDNRPGEIAYAAGDVITMHNGKTVEVLNTDAEGRLILADALSYAQKFKPSCVIDLATLTGSAVRAIGTVAMVGMKNNATKEFDILQKCGYKVHERIIEFPLWEDYGTMIKSEIADIKNIGGAEAGAITAGKFLEHFIDYPWIHLDIAGPAFNSAMDSYRGIGATGWGTRILFEFAKTYSEK